VAGDTLSSFANFLIFILSMLSIPFKLKSQTPESAKVN
jgi:hypothetical protein